MVCSQSIGKQSQSDFQNDLASDAEEDSEEIYHLSRRRFILNGADHELL